MKKVYLVSILICILFSSCFPFGEIDGSNNNNQFFTYHSAYEPVYYARADLDNMIQLQPPREIVNSGKIYIINNLLFVGETRTGFHIFDNSDAKNPVNIKFLQVLGATDVAIRNDILYVNQASDLITVQYDFARDSLRLIKRLENVFPEIRSPDGYYPSSTPKDSLIVNWNLKK